MNLIKTPDDAKSGFQLTPEELRLIGAFRKLNAKEKDLALGFMQNFSERSKQEPASKSHLRLVPARKEGKK